jgi:signal transduction histidine kinase
MSQAASGPDRTGGPVHARDRRHLLLATETFFAERSPAFVIVTSVLLMAVIFAADLATGRTLSPSLFYLLPVALMTWRMGRGAGAVVAGLAAIAWTVSDIVSKAYGAGALAPYWNAAVRFAVLNVVASLLATLRSRMLNERELAHEAIDAADELRTLNDVKDTLLHAVSHDLRGPIAAILGSAQSLERRESLHLSGSDEDTLIDGILQSGRKLNRVVGDLLDLERLDRGLVEPDRAPTDLGSLVGRVVDEAMFADQHPVHVEVAEPLEMDVEGGTIERIVDNLLVNAVRHTPPATPIHVCVERCDGGARISVEDEGPGVPDDIKTLVFQPFRQGAGVHSGAGIGLSLVAKFAELHGGRAWVEDRPGGGATFRVFLPGQTRTPAEPLPSGAARV